MGQIWTSFDKVLMASILPPTEYINYRLHHDRTDLSDTFGNIDTDVIALEDLRPDLDRNKLLQEFIAEVRTVVEAIPTEISSGTGL